MKSRRPRCITFAAFCIALLAIAMLPTGCEWESSGGDSTWDDSVNWANFSGLYRSGSGSSPLVSNFSLTSGGAGNPTDPDADIAEHVVVNQAGGTQVGPLTVLTGAIPYMNSGVAGWSIKPGSVSVTVVAAGSGAQGQFTDDGSGGLSGSFAQLPPASPVTGAGTINYDTGSWSMNLDALYIDDAVITYSYVVLEDLNATSGGSTTTEDPPTSHGWVYTLQVVQTGNQLQLTDNRGFVWIGSLSAMTTPSGDTSGGTAGAVIGTFSATGSSNNGYTITGTFSGTYHVTSSTEGLPTGQLTGRTIQGIWIEPAGNGDLYGVTTDGVGVTISRGTTETE